MYLTATLPKHFAGKVWWKL